MPIRNNLLCVSTPSTGSGWFCRLLAQVAPNLGYRPDLFSPAANPEHEEDLGEWFGCEWPSYRPHIFEDLPGLEMADPIPALMADVFPDEGQQPCYFTRDCWNPAKGQGYIDHFHVFAFSRRFENTFPPNDPCVWAHYDAFHASAVENQVISVPYFGKPLPLASRCRDAYAEAWKAIRSSEVPVIRYETLVTGDPVHVLEELGNAGLRDWCDCTDLARLILETRKLGPRPQTA